MSNATHEAAGERRAGRTAGDVAYPTMRTLAHAWAQFGIWRFDGTGHDKRAKGVLWAADEWDAAARARVRWGPGRYRVCAGNVRGPVVLRYA